MSKQAQSSTAPACPITGCTGTFQYRTSKRGRKYRQCNQCGAFDGARFLTAAEKARKKASKQKPKTKKQIREELEAERQRVLALPQLSVDGFDYAEWFPQLAERSGQMRMEL